MHAYTRDCRSYPTVRRVALGCLSQLKLCRAKQAKALVREVKLYVVGQLVQTRCLHLQEAIDLECEFQCEPLRDYVHSCKKDEQAYSRKMVVI